jgi:hypothetical protein
MIYLTKVANLSILSTFLVIVLSTLPSMVFNLNSLQAQTQTKLTTYTQPGKFSVQYPEGWKIELLPDDYVILVNYRPTTGGGAAPTEAIKTDIVLLTETYEQAVKNIFESIEMLDETLLKQEELIIGGQEALRVWTTGSPFDFPDIMITVIRYSDDQTISMASYYTAKNQEAVGQIISVHNSLRKEE